SLEFLIGRLFADVLCNLGWTETFRAALGDLGVDLNRLRAVEPDAALGHGGLGRLAACFMESMATLGIPAYGYGIRYDHGLFRQVIRDGWQQEYPEEWLSFGNPWEFARPEVIYDIHFGGSVETTTLPTGVKRSVWHPAETVVAVAYDIPIVGGGRRHRKPLRLWSSAALGSSAPCPIHNGGSRGRVIGTGARRSDFQDPLSQRFDPSRARASPSPGIFLCFSLAAGPGATPPAGRRKPVLPAPSIRDPTQ